jgi:hypothetical protein
MHGTVEDPQYCEAYEIHRYLAATARCINIGLTILFKR